MTTSLLHLRPGPLRARAQKTPLALIPVGTVDWHAAHLPVGVDSLLSQAICRELAEQTGGLVAPPIGFGLCRNLLPEAGYYGTVTAIRPATLEHLVGDLLAGLRELDFTHALVLSGHFEPDHFAALQRGVAAAPPGLAARLIMPGDLLEGRAQPQADLLATWPFAGDHAAEFETSLMLHYHPELVDMTQAPETVELTMPGIPPYLHRRFPRRASAEYGRQLRDAILAGGVQMIQAWLAAV